MSPPTYRFRTDNGLSRHYSLHRLQEKAVNGSVNEATECTADDGETWIPLGDLFMATEELHPDETDTQSESTNTSLSAQDDTASMDQEEMQSSEPSAGTRKLKRLARTSGNSRYAKLNEDRKQQKAAGLIKKPEDFVGVSLADGRYRISGRLGKGSMAYVFRAKDSRLETDVVVKIPKPEKLSGDEIRERFRRESQLLVRLAHPHVVKVLDVGEYEKVPYVVMQLLSGGTLTDKMENVPDKSRRMPVDSLKLWVREVGRALDFCAKQGTVHRDVKPANILFDDDDNAYVSDFGLTKIMYGEHTSLNSSETTTGVVLGTPNYIAPEIVLGNPYDGRADQYSLGITVYHTLFGRPPMQGNSATVTMINQTQKQLQLLSDIRSDVSKELALVIRKSIEKDPDKRFETCEEFAEAVTDALRGSSASSISAVIAEPPVPRKKKKKRKPTEQPSQRSSKKKRPQSSPEAAAFGDYLADDYTSEDGSDWLDIASDPLPPKRSGKKKSTKKKKTSGIPVFGMNVHPGVLVGFGVTAALGLLLSIIFATGGNEPDSTPVTSVPPPADSQNANENSSNQTAVTVAQTPKSNNGTPAAANNGGQGAKQGNPNNRKNKNRNKNQPADSTSPPPSQPATSVAGKTPVQPISASKPAPPQEKPKAAPKPAANVASVKTPFKAIPWEPGQNVTVGASTNAVLVSGTTVWDKASGAVKGKLDGQYTGQVQTALSPDGRLFAAATKPIDQQNNTVVVWDTQTGKQLFTVPGDNKRFADAILLSSESLFVGDRWSSELLVWDCSTGKKSKSIRIEEAKFKPGNATISNDGQYIAVVAQGRMIVVNAKDGKFVAVMQNPADSPILKRASLMGDGAKTDSKRRTEREAEPIFAAMRSLRFSADNQELAGFSNHPRGRMMCWNNVGKATVDHAAFTSYDKPLGNAALQWFETRKAWFVAGRVTLRQSGRVVLTTQPGDGTVPDVHVYDDDHLVGVLPSAPTQLSIIPIPWGKMDGSLKTLRDGGPALLSPETSAAVQVNLQPHVKPGSSEIADIRKAIRSTVTRDGLKVEQNRNIVFRVRIASSDAASPILNRMLPPEFRRPGTGGVNPGNGEFVVVELQLPGKPQPVWRANLGSVSDLGLTGGAVVSTDELIRRLDSLVVPYFIPQDENALALPIVLN